MTISIIKYSLLFFILFILISPSFSNNFNSEENINKVLYKNKINYTSYINDVITYSTNDPKEINIILNDTYDENITINSENNDKYIFTIDTNKYIYSFESNDPSYIVFDKDKPCPSICIFQKDAENHQNKIYINYNKNIPEKDIKIRIKSYPNIKGRINSMTLSNINIDKAEKTKGKNILIIEPKEDYIFYFKTFEKNVGIFYAEYDSDMNINDIIDINEDYFISYDNKIKDAKNGKTYIIVYSTDINEKLLYILMQPKFLNEQIDISGNELQNNFYLSDTSKEYTLNFEKNKYDRIIHLSKTTIDSEIIIKNGNKETILNSSNPYYLFDNINGIFTGKLTLKNTKKETGSLIEFLYAINENDYEILEEQEYDEKRLTKPIIMKFNHNTENSRITITISSKKEKEFNYKYITGYSINNYINFPIETIPDLTGNSTYELNINNKKGNTNDETLYLIIYINSNILSDDNYEIIMTKIENDKKGLEAWIIVFIIVGCVIALIIIFLIVYRFTCFKNDNDDSPGSLISKDDTDLTT